MMYRTTGNPSGGLSDGPILPSVTNGQQRIPLHTMVEARTGLNTTEYTPVFFGSNSEIRDDYTWDDWFDGLELFQ